MSVQAMAWVWAHSRSEPTDRLVLLAIADCANDAGAEAYPSLATLTTKTGLHERSIQRSLNRLVGIGELTVQPRGGPHGCNRYRVTMAPGRQSPRQTVTPAESRLTPGTAPPHPRHSAVSTPGTAPPEPSFNHQGTIKEPSVVPRDRFGEFWATYPRKAAKDAAKRAWTKALKRADPDRIIAGSSRYRDDPGRDPQFTKYPATWLNDGCWDDEPLPRGSPNGRASPHATYRNPTDASAYTEGL